MNNIKEYRRDELKSYVIGNILLFLFLSGVLDTAVFAELNNYYNLFGVIVQSAIFSSVIYIYVFLLDSIIPGNYKFQIAYLPFGKMPACTIFSEMEKSIKDNRFTQEEALKKYAEIYEKMPEDEVERDNYENSRWYSIYKKYENVEKIYIANKDFLLCRDITIITLMLAILYGCSCVLHLLPFSWEIIVLLIVEYVITNAAMRGKGKRLAYNVITEDIHSNIKK